VRRARAPIAGQRTLDLLLSALPEALALPQGHRRLRPWLPRKRTSRQKPSPPDRPDQERGHDKENPVRRGSADRGTQTISRTTASFSIWRREWRLAQLTGRRPGGMRGMP
jgi:hypothetical protein